MEELKACPQEAEALDILESLLDVADLKCTGPLYADAPPRSGMCRIPEDDAAKLRKYIAARRAAPENKPDLSDIDRVIRLYEDVAECPCDTYAQLILAALYEYKAQHVENKPLTLDQLRQMDGEPVWIAILDGSEPTRCEIVVECYKDGIKMASAEETDDYGAFDLYGKTWLAYARRPEDAK